MRSGEKVIKMNPSLLGGAVKGSRRSSALLIVGYAKPQQEEF